MPIALHIDWDIIWKIVAAFTGASFSVLSYLSARTLNKIDTNQTELFDRIHTLEITFYELRGEHIGRDLYRCRTEDQVRKEI